MYEDLILNKIRAISWKDFWEPTSAKQKCIKWGCIALLIILGMSIFLLRLNKLLAYEYASGHPVIVEAERKLVYTHEPYHDIYLSYTCNDVKYENIYYGYSKNPSIRWDGVTTMSVAVDPGNPAQPIHNMFSPTPTIFAVMLWSLGLSMLIYGVALLFPSFRAWCVKQGNKPGFLGLPYGKPTTHSENPEYLTCLIVAFIPIMLIHAILLLFLFPYTF